MPRGYIALPNLPGQAKQTKKTLKTTAEEKFKVCCEGEWQNGIVSEG